jgi:heat shock protein beta
MRTFSLLMSAACLAAAVNGDRVDEVEVSSRLEASPSALVQPQWGMSPQMQRFMQREEAKKAKESLKPVTDFLKSVLGDRVDKVEVSSGLEASPSALVQPQWGMSPQMRAQVAAQGMSPQMRAQVAAQGTEDAMMAGMAANLEINPKHAVVARLQAMVGKGGDGKADGASKGFAELLYDVAAVASGYELTNPGAFARRVVALMEGGEAALATLEAAEEAAAAEAEATATGLEVEAPDEDGDTPVETEVV